MHIKNGIQQSRKILDACLNRNVLRADLIWLKFCWEQTCRGKWCKGKWSNIWEREFCPDPGPFVCQDYAWQQHSQTH